MKKTLRLVLLLLPTICCAAGLPIDFSKETQYTPYKTNGIIYMLHASLLDDKKETDRALEYISKILLEVEKTIPNTVDFFKKTNGKIFLYELSFSKGGMEYVRKNQYAWDSRYNHIIDNCIVIPNAYSFSSAGQNGFAYLIHEMAHFHHLNVMEYKFDKEIRNLYTEALNNSNYVGAYGSTNFLEYFAEISTAYLLESHRISRFPKGSKELYLHDRSAYDFCKKIWGEKLAAYKAPNIVLATLPSANTALPVTVPVSPVTIVTSPVFINAYSYNRSSSFNAEKIAHFSTCRCSECSMILLEKRGLK